MVVKSNRIIAKIRRMVYKSKTSKRRQNQRKFTEADFKKNNILKKF